MAFPREEGDWNPDLTQIRSFARETAGVSLPPAPSPLDDPWSFSSKSRNGLSQSPPPPPLARGSRASIDAYASSLLGTTMASMSSPAFEGDMSQRTIYPGEFNSPEMYESEKYQWPSDEDRSPDARNMYSEGENYEGATAGDTAQEDDDSEEDEDEMPTKKKVPGSNGPVLVENWKPKKRRIPKVPWDPFLFKMGDLSGNSEMCGCGNIFLAQDTFCFRCGNRRPVDVRPLPLHVERLPAPPIENVCQRLYAWAPAYRQRREDLQLLQRENEDSAKKQEHPGTPAINPLSSDLAKHLRPISERYKGIMWMKEFQLQREREKQANEAIKDFTWEPEIHPKSKKVERGLNSLYRWKKKIDTRNENLRTRKWEMETANCTFIPQLGNCSRRLAMSIESSGHQHNVHDRLYVDAQKRRWAQEVEQQAAAQRFATSTKSGGSRSNASGRKSGRSSSRGGSPSRGASLQRSASARSMPTPPPPASAVIKGLNSERMTISCDSSSSRRARSFGDRVKFSKSSMSGSMVSLDGRMRSRASTPETPKAQNRGPRASMAVLPKKGDLEESSKRKKWRKMRSGQTITHPMRSASASNGLGQSLSARSFTDEEEDNYVMPKSVWTGGSNVIMIDSQYEDLLSQCAPDLPQTESKRMFR